MSIKNELRVFNSPHKCYHIPEFLRKRSISGIKQNKHDTYKADSFFNEFSEFTITLLTEKDSEERITKWIENTPRIHVIEKGKFFKVQIESPSNLLIDQLKEMNKKVKLEKIKLALVALLNLNRQYGYFICNNQMLKIDQNQNPVVWIHSEFLENRPEIPIQNSEEAKHLFFKTILSIFTEVLEFHINEYISISTLEGLISYVGKQCECTLTTNLKNVKEKKQNTLKEGKVYDYQQKEKEKNSLFCSKSRSVSPKPFSAFKSFSPIKKATWAESLSLSHLSKISLNSKNPEKQQRSERSKIIKELLFINKLRIKKDTIQISNCKSINAHHPIEHSKTPYLSVANVKANYSKSTASVNKRSEVSQCSQSIECDNLLIFDDMKLSSSKTNIEYSSVVSDIESQAKKVEKRKSETKKVSETMSQEVFEENDYEYENSPLIRINVCEASPEKGILPIFKNNERTNRNYRKKSEDISKIWFNSQREIDYIEFKTDKVLEKNTAFSSRDTLSSIKLDSKGPKNKLELPELESNEEEVSRLAFLRTGKKYESEKEMKSVLSSSEKKIEDVNEKISLKIKEEDEISLEAEFNNVLNSSLIPSEPENENNQKSLLNVKQITESVITKELNSLFGDDSFFEADERKDVDYFEDFSNVLE